MKYQTMPPLSTEDYDALRESIVKYGVTVPVLLDEEGAIIDGHHRAEIAQALGIVYATEVRDDLTEDEKVALSISLNIDRRQLTREQKREIVAKRLVAAPETSNRQIAQEVGVHHETVQSVRVKLVEKGDVADSATRTDSLGRQQPATKATITLTDCLAEFPDLRHYVEANSSMTALRIGKELFALDGDKRAARLVDVLAEIEEQQQPLEPVPTKVDIPEPSPVEAILDADPVIQDKKYMHEFYKALNRASEYRQFDAERIGRLASAEDFRTLELEVQTTQKFLDTMRKAGSGLRLIAGGKA